MNDISNVKVRLKTRSGNKNIKQYPGKTNDPSYKTLVKPIPKYVSVIWDQFTDDNVWNLELVQHRSASMVFSNYRSTRRVTPMLQQLLWPTNAESKA